MKKKLDLNVDMPKEIHERLEACLTESDNPETVARVILREFRIWELEYVLSKLVSLYDKSPHLLNLFWQSSSDACPLESSESEKQEDLFFKWVYNGTRD